MALFTRRSKFLQVPSGHCTSACTDVHTVPCSASALKDPVTSLIDRLGNTKVLSREVEAKLTRIIRKGLDMEVAIAASEAKLKRPLSVPEVVKLLVSPGAACFLTMRSSVCERGQSRLSNEAGADASPQGGACTQRGRAGLVILSYSFESPYLLRATQHSAE